MYHAPVSADPAPQEISTAEMPDGEVGYDSVGVVEGSQVQDRQAEAAAHFAPFYALASVGSALIAAWAMFGTAEIAFIAGWLAVLAGANWFVYRRAIDAAAAAGSRSAPRRASWGPLAEALGISVLWSALPVYAFAALPPASQVALGLAFGAVVAASASLVAAPAAAIASVSCFGLAFSAAYFTGSPSLDPKIGAGILGFVAIAAYGVTRLAGWAHAQIRSLAKVKNQAESIRLLLREYEHRGVGWLWQVDSENRVVYISSRMTALLGRSTSQLFGHSLPASLGGNSALGRTLLARQPFSNLEMELKTRRGTRWISLAGDPIIDMKGEFQGFRGVGSDVTEVRKTQERLTNLANMDVLSGLPNRGRVRQLLGEALSTAQATNVPCAIMFLDLDGFKPVNDTFGHPKGDAVLKSVAQRLVKEVGDAGHVGRMGGDEFAIVIKDAQGRKTVENLAKRLIESVAAPYHIDKVEIRIGTSIGCAFGPIDGQTVDDLIQKADMALYQAKNEGRGTCCYFNDDMRSVAEHRMRLEQDLSNAIAAGQLRLLYQPLISAADQSLVGFEALIRWHHPTRGIVPPNDFIPLAEETGLIMNLGDWVIEEACRAAATWPEHITVAVNLSARQLVLPALPATVNASLSKHRVQANRLELEVTETVFLEDTAGSLDVLKRLRALGVGIALDDFGTGYSSLGYLNKAVFHKLKIDGSFVREAAQNKETVAIIQSIVQLAKSFRMTITAEGVETADDFTRMRDLGCHQIQGYLFGRPMSYERASELVHGTSARKSA
jgi:diguanylate cyclase (GGDEF)-like protein/PAS domain S-box-containing protein